MRVTVGVLAGAYRVLKTTHTHRAEDNGGWPIPLCKRVKLGSLTDDSTQFTQERPTCPVCARIFDQEAL